MDKEITLLIQLKHTIELAYSEISDKFIRTAKSIENNDILDDLYNKLIEYEENLKDIDKLLERSLLLERDINYMIDTTIKEVY